MPELLSYWIETPALLVLARHVNAAIGALVASHPKQFVGLGMVPLQDPQLAAKELQRLKSVDGLIGVEIGSNINGRSPGDPFFDDFYAEAERLGMCVFVHALRPAATERLVGPKPLAAFIGFPSDVGFAASSFITGGTLRRFPALRLAFSHGGGTLAAILPRLQQGWLIAPELKSEFDSPVETARRFYYDNIVFDERLLRYLIQTFGASQIVAGSDYPYLAGQRFPAKPFEALDLTVKELADLHGGNARRFLNLLE